MREVKLGPWPAGMNNVAEDYAMPVSQYGRPIAMRNAVNVDFDNTGLVARRDGYSKAYSGLNTRAGFSCSAGTYFVEGSALKLLDVNNNATTIFNGVLGEHCSYEYFNGVVYFSDGVISKKIKGSVVISWGLDVPNPPLLTSVPGTLGVGTYLCAVTFVDADGAESGASEAVSITLNVSSGISIGGLPVSPGAVSLRLYLSTANDTTLYMAKELSVGSSSYVISGGYLGEGKPLDLQFVSRPPPGRIVRHFRGRMYIADAYGAIWYTEPGAFDHVRLAGNFFQFSVPVTVMEPVKSGLWIVADKTYFYAGTGPQDFAPQEVLGYGAVFGTGQRVPNTDDVMWYSARGVVKGTSAGQVENLQETHVAAENGSSGAAMIREADGVQQFIASIKDPVVSPLIAQSFFSAEIIRKATL